MKKLIILTMVFYIFSLAVAADNIWVKDPTNCPNSYEGVGCGSDYVCGYIPPTQCYDNTLIAIPAVYNSDYETQVSGTGQSTGYVLDCLADDGLAPPPYCNLWKCQINTTCYSTKFRTTNCTSTTVAHCADCRSGYLNCTGDPTICEIHVGESCTITASGLSGTCQACLPDTGTDGDGNHCNCVGAPVNFQTGIEADYATTNPLLWGRQYGTGWLMNLTNATGATFGVNASGCIIFPDGSKQCVAGGDGTSVWIDNGTQIELKPGVSKAVAFGTNNSFGKITASKPGSLAHGNSTGVALGPASITASGDGAYASGYALSGDITASGDGSHASGFAASGESITASGTTAFAHGRDVAATGEYSTVIGYRSTASGNYAFASGYDVSAEAQDAVAFGHLTNASGMYSFVAGEENRASDYSFAMGHNANATGGNALAIGTAISASGSGSIALGGYSTSSSLASVTLGTLCEASNDYSTAIGYQSTANAQYSTAIGRLTISSGRSSLATGYNTTASGFYSTATGDSTTASGESSFAMGWQTNASGSASTATGYRTTASGDYSTAMGNLTVASGPSSVALGVQTTAGGKYSTAMGWQTNASGDYSIAIGHVDTNAQGLGSIAMGYRATASASGSFIWGGGTCSFGPCVNNRPDTFAVFGALCVAAPGDTCPAGAPNGEINAGGNINANAFDMAERILSDYSYEPGDVVVIDTTKEQQVTVSTQPYSTLVAGIISSDPGFTLGWRNESITQALVALAGRVPVKVTDENGPIEIGDLLTTSSTPGYAMKCDDKIKCMGAVVGKAMEPFAEERGKIVALVTLQ